MGFEWKESIDQFIFLANKKGVRMLMVGGGAVNFHGYQRHSADVDFWIETTHKNLQNLATVFTEMGYEIEQFPDAVKDQFQNISVKFSPADLDLELITKFEIGKSFNEAFQEAISVEISVNPILRWKVLSWDDLLESKRRAARPKDLLDIQQLKSLKK